MKRVCVFCSALDVDDVYVNTVQAFGQLLGLHGYGLVWGGSNTGLMKVLADAVQQSGGTLFGVSVESLRDVARDQADEMIITKDLNERKKRMREKADAFVTLVGGTGTLDELSEIIEQKILGYHDKPIIIVNTNNFYDGLLSQYRRMKEEGFLKEDLGHIFVTVDTPQSAIQFLDHCLSS
ncbi:MAG: TIGR00730 family Rossman fold protein [Patescibacteria group bacterium]|nr:TIGR00730 family Rossman fold protein [Patescibacteria group bacterium]